MIERLVTGWKKCVPERLTSLAHLIVNVDGDNRELHKTRLLNEKSKQDLKERAVTQTAMNAF